MSSLGLTLKPVEKCLKNLVCYEPVDVSVLDKLLKSDLLVSVWDEEDDFKYSNEREQLQAYRKIIKNGKAEVQYVMPTGMDFGRCNPKESLGLFTIRRQIRHTLTKGRFVDIDIENAHPTILYQICKQNSIECDNLEDYVENRQEHLKQVMDFFGVSKDLAKNLYIRLLYFGGFEGWATKNTISKPATKNIKNFKKELTEIGNVIASNNKLIGEQIKKRKEKQKQKEYNEIGSIVSYYLQEIECRILETIYNHCITNGFIKDKIVILCADGLMIEESNYKEELLTTFSTLIKEKFNLQLKFTTKALDEDYLAILDDHIISEKELVQREIPDYSLDYTIDTTKDFNIATLNDIFFNDIAELGEERYLKYFEWTKSFKYFDHYHAHFYIANQIHKIHQNTIIAYSDFKGSFDHLKLDFEKRTHKFTTLYMENRYKQTYSTFQFDPRKEAESDKYNLFRGFIYDTTDNTTYDEKVVETFINHIKYICKEDKLEAGVIPKVSNYMLDWFAHILQKPYMKTKVAIVIFSLTEGVGKNAISDIFSELVSGYAGKFRDTAALTDKFNGEMMGKLFVVGDEIKAKAQEVANELKDIITRLTENIEFKGKDKVLLNDYKNYFFTTNNENVFKVSNTDRRFMFIEAPEEKKDKAYYTELFEFKDDKVKMKHLFNYLMRRDVSSFSPSEIVETEYKKRIIMANLPAYIKFVKEQYTYLSNVDYESKKSVEWRVADLYAESVDYAHKNKLQSTYTEHMFSVQFKKVFGEHFQKQNKARQSVYIFPKGLESMVDECINKNYLN